MTLTEEPFVLKRLLVRLLVLVALLSGCSQAPTHEHELRLVLPLEPVSLSPLYAFVQDQIALDTLWCQTLIGLDERNHFEPILVTRVPTRANGDISADGRRITYHLRRGVRFADGVPLTSADVAFTYHAILAPVNAAPTVSDYERIAALTTPDDYTVVIRLRTAWSAAVHVLFAQADEAYGILPKHAFTSLTVTHSSWDQKPFGSGPFRVVAWRRGDRIELEPNPYFAPKPRLTRVIVRIVPDQTTAFNTLKTHDADVAELNPDNVAQAATLTDFRVTHTPENGIRALYLQTNAPPTNDVHLRRAIAYALDLPTMAKAWHGLFPLGSSIFPAPVLTWRHTPGAPYAHDIVQAGRELDLAGWVLRGKVRRNSAGVPLSLLVATDATVPITGRIAVIAQQQLAAVGIDVAVKAYTTATYSAPDGPLRSGGFAMTPARYIGGSDPEQSLNLTCVGAHTGGDNYSRYCVPAFERLYAAQMVAGDERLRRREFDAIARLVHSDVPLIPLYDLQYIEAVNRRIMDYRRNMLRFPVHAETWDAR